MRKNVIILHIFGEEKLKSIIRKNVILLLFNIAQTRQQKWKTALRGPPGRLVTSLKVGTNMDNSKHRYVQNFKGHIDGIWHVTTAQISSCQILASASAGMKIIFKWSIFIFLQIKLLKFGRLMMRAVYFHIMAIAAP